MVVLVDFDDDNDDGWDWEEEESEDNCSIKMEIVDCRVGFLWFDGMQVKLLIENKMRISQEKWTMSEISIKWK